MPTLETTHWQYFFHSVGIGRMSMVYVDTYYTNLDKYSQPKEIKLTPAPKLVRQKQ